jgi:uncharacterized membrane protein (UPF0127 family)
MKESNPFKILPAIILIQILLAITLGSNPAIKPNEPGKETQNESLTGKSAKPKLDFSNSTVGFPNSKTSLGVEVAENRRERRRGLMFRENLPIDKGMLFVFPEERNRSFWMKNTYIPLDMIFVDSQGRVVNTREAYPEPETSDENLNRYRSASPVKYVVEANSSFVERRNVEKGDRVVIPTRFQ